MGLYSTFSTSQYYDEPPIKKSNISEVEKKNVDKKNKVLDEHNVVSSNQHNQVKRKTSLYEEAKEIASSRKSEYANIDFKTLYRVGQPVAIKDEKGVVKTAKGRVIEIVAKDLMYVAMEDTYKDVNDQWLIYFVTPKDKIYPL